jgi:hypothetical protein
MPKRSAIVAECTAQYDKAVVRTLRRVSRQLRDGNVTNKTKQDLVAVYKDIVEAFAAAAQRGDVPPIAGTLRRLEQRRR